MQDKKLVLIIDKKNIEKLVKFYEENAFERIENI